MTLSCRYFMNKHKEFYSLNFFFLIEKMVYFLQVYKIFGTKCSTDFLPVRDNAHKYFEGSKHKTTILFKLYAQY